MYPSDKGPEIKADFKKIEELTAEFEKVRPLLKETIGEKDFMKAIQLLEQIHKLGAKLGSFAGLWFSADTQDQGALALMAKTEQLSADLGNRTLFFGLWWKDLPEDPAARLMKSSGDYRYWLEEMRHFKPHTLTEAEEKIINTKNVTGINALTTLYDSITNRYVFKIEARRAVVTEADGNKQAAITIAEGNKQAAILNAEGAKQSAILTAEGERQAAILRAEGFSSALDKIFQIASTVDEKTMRLQYLDALKQVGTSPSSKVVVPMELSGLVATFTALAEAASTNGSGGDGQG